MSGGSASVEMVLITPVLVVLLLFVVAIGRLASAQGEVESAARDAARAAASGRSTTAAQALGSAAATATLADRGVECTSLTVEMTPWPFEPTGSSERRCAASSTSKLSPALDCRRRGR